MTTKGSDRVSIDLQPPQEALDLIKQINDAAAELIDLIDGLTGDAEVERLKALAMTAIEQGGMWGTKATTRSTRRK